MAQQRKPNMSSEPVNSEQAEALELVAREEPAPAAPLAGPGASSGELEERTVAAEDRAEAAERANAQLAVELEELRGQVQALLRQASSPQARSDSSDRDAAELGPQPGAPLFDENQPHGVVVGDERVAFVQDGHQFGRDRQYLATEKNRGCPRPFNPRLVGLTKPRPGQTLGDALDGFRDR
jgi:hypothetical protein